MGGLIHNANIPDRQFKKFKGELVNFVNNWSYTDDCPQAETQKGDIELNKTLGMGDTEGRKE